MDWKQAMNQETLKRILVMLVTMASLAGLRIDAAIAGPCSCRRAPRHTRRLLLRLLRPTEAAMRRLFVIAVSGLVETFQAPRKPKSHQVFGGVGAGLGTNTGILRARDSPF